MIYGEGTTVYTKENEEMTIKGVVAKPSTGEVIRYKALLRDGVEIEIERDKVSHIPQSLKKKSSYIVDVPWKETSLVDHNGERVMVIGVTWVRDEFLTVPICSQFKVLYKDGSTSYLKPEDVKVKKR